MGEDIYKRTERVLYNYKTIKAEAENINITIQAMESDYQGVTAVGFTEPTSPTHKFNSVVENEVVIRDKQLGKLQAELKNKEQLIRKIENALGTLSEREYRIIEMKYFKKFKTWEKIAENVELSGDYARTLGREIVLRVGKIIFIEKYV